MFKTYSATSADPINGCIGMFAVSLEYSGSGFVSDQKRSFSSGGKLSASFIAVSTIV
jgi:hypothetical protein